MRGRAVPAPFLSLEDEACKEGSAVDLFGDGAALE
jgi:hypothetical protein